MFRPLRFRSLFLFTAFAFALFFYFHHPHDVQPLYLESLALEEYMNNGAPIHNLAYVESSFEWNKIEFEHPSTKQKALPSVTPGVLPRVQHVFPEETLAAAEIREARRAEVKKVFKKSWDSYKKYAWMKDALLPVSGKYKDQFCGWAATLVDTLDTLWMMGMKEEFEEAVAAVATIDFGKSTSGNVNTFETTIRYLGGLLAAYDLSNHKVLLDKAIEVGDMIYAGFNTPNRMPVDFINYDKAKTGEGLTVEAMVVSASPGSLSLEFTRLAQLTGEPKYYEAISRITDLFYNHQNETGLPGMWPMFVSMSREDVVSGYQFSIAGNADSLYEYFPKMYALLGGAEPQYEIISRGFMETARKNLFFRPMVPDQADILISGNVDVDDEGNPSLDPESEHLACFIGGVYALGGRLLKNEQYVEIGAKLTKGCIYAYKSFPTGIMPERYNMVICDDPNNCPWDEEKWQDGILSRPQYKEHLPKGFTTAKDPRYLLRPEAIESVFVLYRITGRQEFQEAAWDMFQAVANGTATEFAAAAVLDVTLDSYPLPQEDYMESFWLAETLKYFYLVFSPPDLVSLDDYVLNTEAHPLRRSDSWRR